MPHQAVEGGDAESAGMGAEFHARAGHLSAAHAAFLKKWLGLVDLEEGSLSARRAEIWALSGQSGPHAGCY